MAEIKPPPGFVMVDDDETPAPPPGFVLEGEKPWYQKAWDGVSSAYQGQHDPKFQDVPAYVPPKGTDDYQTTQYGKLTTTSDAAYGDIIKAQLGDRLLRSETDANGYEVITYRDQDGATRQAYINKPGFDFQDLDRGVGSAVPYLIGGGLVGAASKGVGTLGRMAVQGMTGVGTSTAQDVGATLAGSKQPYDTARAAAAGLGGAFGEALAPAVSGLYRFFRSGKAHVAPDGTLTRTAAETARRVGLDPNDMSADEIMKFARGLDETVDPQELGSKILTDRFGIETTKATRTKDPRLSLMEKNVRMGNVGDEAKKALDDFDRRQALQIQEAALGRSVPENQAADPYKTGVGGMIAPHRAGQAPVDMAPAQFGQSIQDGLKRAERAGDDLINKAWEEMGDLYAGDEALASLGTSIGKRLSIKVDNTLTPAAAAMKKDLMDYASGAYKKGDDFYGAEIERTVDQQRRRLLHMKNGAQNDSDRRAANDTYGAFESWIDDMAEKGFMAGDPLGAAKMRTARELTREIKGLFKPTKHGKATPEGNILEKVIENDFNPDSIVGTILGQGGPRTVPKDGAVKALVQIKKALFSPVAGKQLIDAETAARAWNDIRMAYWSRLVLNNKSTMHTPTMVGNNIEQAFRNQQGFLRTMFSDEEMSVMWRFMKSVRAAEFKDPNPAGTATARQALKQIMRSPTADSLKLFLNTQSKRELFSKHNVVMSRIYQLLARNVPNMATSGNFGRRLADRQTGQALTQRPPVTLGGVGAAYGAQDTESPNRLLDALRGQ